jgi:hypothetical protein
MSYISNFIKHYALFLINHTDFKFNMSLLTFCVLALDHFLFDFAFRIQF